MSNQISDDEALKERRESNLFLDDADPNDLIILCPEEFNPANSWYKFAEKLLPHAERVFWKGDGTEDTSELYMRGNQIRCLRAVLRGSGFVGDEDKLSVAAWMLSIMCEAVPDLNTSQIWLLRKQSKYLPRLWRGILWIEEDFAEIGLNDLI